MYGNNTFFSSWGNTCIVNMRDVGIGIPTRKLLIAIPFNM